MVRKWLKKKIMGRELSTLNVLLPGPYCLYFLIPFSIISKERVVF